MNAKNDSSDTIALCHVGMFARKPASLAKFYSEVMGMQVVGGSDASHAFGASAFLSSRPGEESHELAMFTNPALAHSAFKVRSLAALKRFHQKVVARGLPIVFQFLHGVSIAFYFHDPEGNMIEVYWSTGLECPQPYAQEIDLTRPEEELLEELKVLTGQKGSSLSTNQEVSRYELL